PIAEGIKLRADSGVTEPLNIIICENLLRASEVLRGYILAALPPEYEGYVREHVGLVESVVSRMVPVMTDEQRERDPLLVVVEEYKKLPVDRKGFVGPIPEIVGMEPRENFGGYVERKLFTHNMGHAVAAYLGYLRGHEYIWQAVGDPAVTTVLRAALAETGAALVKKHGFTPEEHQAHIEDLLHRFANVALGDTVARVGRDPIRKLGPEDRLIGGAKLAMQYGITPRNVCTGIAAALLFDPADDPAARKIQQMTLDEVFVQVCGIDAAGELAGLIREQLSALKSGGLSSDLHASGDT
ncbi:MAG: mannitol dehydrogenase family protein, partial [Armatimonadota bacterium]